MADTTINANKIILLLFKVHQTAAADKKHMFKESMFHAKKNWKAEWESGSENRKGRGANEHEKGPQKNSIRWPRFRWGAQNLCGFNSIFVTSSPNLIYVYIVEKGQIYFTKSLGQERLVNALGPYGSTKSAFNEQINSSVLRYIMVFPFAFFFVCAKGCSCPGIFAYSMYILTETLFVSFKFWIQQFCAGLYASSCSRSWMNINVRMEERYTQLVNISLKICSHLLLRGNMTTMKRSAVIATKSQTALLPMKLTTKNMEWQWGFVMADGTKLNKTQYCNINKIKKNCQCHVCKNFGWCSWIWLWFLIFLSEVSLEWQKTCFACFVNSQRDKK